ncbi:MAG: transposase [Verrucomicrobiota bacterium]
MSQTPKPRRPSPPHNTGVRDLVEGKRQWSSPPKIENLKQGFRGWHERGYLPHRDEPGLTQFVTFHLADCFPESLHSEWEHFAKTEDDRERRKLIEAYLDKGRGECHLRRPEIAKLVEDNFLNFSNCYDSQSRAPRYELRSWCIMPNHVHVLFKVGAASMSEIVAAWKKHTGRLANKLLGKQGAFWAEDYFDTYMRDAEHERMTVRYIENNSTKAKLVLNPKEWRWSSARIRDENGVLRLQRSAVL